MDNIKALLSGRTGAVGVVAVATMVAFACSSGGGAGAYQECALSSDCGDGLSCAFGQCRPTCASNVDCGAGGQCVSDSTRAVCRTSAEQGCDVESDCDSPLACAGDFRCRNLCVTDGDCNVHGIGGQLCAKDHAGRSYCAEASELGPDNKLGTDTGSSGSSGGGSSGGGSSGGGSSGGGSSGGGSSGGGSSGGSSGTVVCVSGPQQEMVRADSQSPDGLMVVRRDDGLLFQMRNVGLTDYVTSMAPMKDPSGVNIVTEQAFVGTSSGYFVCATKQDKKLYCWTPSTINPSLRAKNQVGNMGNGGTGNATTTPTTVKKEGLEELTDVRMVSPSGLGATGMYIVTGDEGALWFVGQPAGVSYLFSGFTVASYARPVPVSRGGAQMTGVKSLGNGSVGASHMCVVKVDDTLWCIGHNAYGQLGDGFTDNPDRFVQANVSNIVDFSISSSGTCAVNSAGNVLCWGQVQNALGYDPNSHGVILQPEMMRESSGGSVIADAKSVRVLYASNYRAPGSLIRGNERNLYTFGNNNPADTASAFPQRVTAVTGEPNVTPGAFIRDVKSLNFGYESWSGAGLLHYVSADGNVVMRGGYGVQPVHLTVPCGNFAP